MTNFQRRWRHAFVVAPLSATVWFGAVQASAAARTPPLAQQSPTEEVLEYGNVVNQAALRGDATMLAAARLNLKSLIPSAESVADMRLLYYTAGYASWEFSLQTSDLDDARGATFDAAAQLRESLVFDSRYSEAQILRAMVHAQLLKLAGSSVAYDPAIGAALVQAQVREPRSPRIALAMGVVAFLAPEAFAAGPGDAEQALKRAEILFAAEPDTNPWPNWGKAQTEAWLGQVLAKKGDTAGARQAYERALILRPQYAWVKDTLLPALK